jgi:hypothetical protein
MYRVPPAASAAAVSADWGSIRSRCRSRAAN